MSYDDFTEIIVPGQLMGMLCERVLTTLFISKYITYTPFPLFYNIVVLFKEGNWMALASLIYGNAKLLDSIFLLSVKCLITN